MQRGKFLSVNDSVHTCPCATEVFGQGHVHVTWFRHMTAVTLKRRLGKLPVKPRYDLNVVFVSDGCIERHLFHINHALLWLTSNIITVHRVLKGVPSRLLFIKYNVSVWTYIWIYAICNLFAQFWENVYSFRTVKRNCCQEGYYLDSRLF